MKDAFSKPKSILEIDDIEKPFVKFMKSIGWICEKVVSMSRKGWPDRFCAKGGRIVLVELKAPGKRPDPIQESRHRELRAAGIEVAWFDNLADAKAYFLK